MWIFTQSGAPHKKMKTCHYRKVVGNGGQNKLQTEKDEYHVISDS